MKTKFYRTNDGKLIKILSNHQYGMKGGMKGVCATAILSYLGVTPDKYSYTSSKTNVNAYENVLRRFGYSVRSRKSAFKGAKTVSQVSKVVKSYEDYTPDVYYLIHVDRHVLLLNSDGKTVVDTDPRKRDRRKVISVRAVFVDK
jgi:hypothetical protein